MNPKIPVFAKTVIYSISTLPKNFIVAPNLLPQPVPKRILDVFHRCIASNDSKKRHCRDGTYCKYRGFNKTEFLEIVWNIRTDCVEEKIRADIMNTLAKKAAV